MVPIERTRLSAAAFAVLDRRQQRINESDDPVAAARQLWSSFHGSARTEIQAKLRAMAPGHQRCMYCEDGMGTDIDHFRPKRTYPNWAFLWDNYLLACSYCNSNAKRDEFPILPDGEIALIDPTVDDPSAHLAYSPSTGMYVGRDKRGEESIRVFGLNRQVCVAGRKDAWTAFEALALSYRSMGRPLRTVEVVQKHPFQGVLRHIREIMDSPARDLLLSPALVAALQSSPELLEPTGAAAG